MKKPTISIMLCAYNASRYIREAIDSILAQTYNDFECVIVDDGSTDDTLEIIQSYRDSRIRTIACPHNYIKSLNTGMRVCRGKYIARMDADDRITPNRLERQYAVMEENPEIAVCFSWGRTFGQIEEPIGHCAKGRINHSYFWLLTGNYLMHPTAMIRSEFIRIHHIKYKEYPYAEDYKLWTDITRIGGVFYVIPEPLFYYRISKSQVSVKHRKEQIETLKHPKKKALRGIYQRMLELNQADLMQGYEVVATMYRLFRRTHFFV